MDRYHQRKDIPGVLFSMVIIVLACALVLGVGHAQAADRARLEGVSADAANRGVIEGGREVAADDAWIEIGRAVTDRFNQSPGDPADSANLATARHDGAPFIVDAKRLDVPSPRPINGVILRQQLDAGDEGYTVLHVWGSHEEMGYAHAWLLAEYIVTMVNDLEEYLGATYTFARTAMGQAVWKPDELEDELAGMVTALAVTHPDENIDILDLKVLNGVSDWLYPVACRSHSCWGSFTADPVTTLSTRRLDFTTLYPSMGHHVLCAWEPDDGSPWWVNFGWAGYVVVISAVNEYGTQASLHDYDTGGTVPSNPLLRSSASRWILTLPDGPDVANHVTDGFAALQAHNAGTGSFINYFAPDGHGGVISCSRADGFYDLRLPQPSYYGGDVLMTANSWTDGTYTPTGGEFMASYYDTGGPKDLLGHWNLMGSSGLHKMSLAYRGERDMTIWSQGRLTAGITPRMEWEWDDLFGGHGTGYLVTGPGPGPDNPPVVRVFPLLQDADPIYEFTVYGVPRYGVNIGSGDLDNDGVVEILTGPGPGAVFGPHVRAYEPEGVAIPGVSFLAYGTNRWGVNVTGGDIDGDGYDEIITGAGPGAVFGPHVRAFDYDGSTGVTPVPGVSYFAYGTHRWGVNVAAGDIDGDGIDEIITGAGPGAVFGPHVRGWNVDSGPATPIPGISFLAYGTNRFGVRVSSADLDGDGIDELITAPGPSAAFGAHIRGWDCDSGSAVSMDDLNFFAWPPSEAQYGATVSTGLDLMGSGRDQFAVGAGPDPDVLPVVKVYEYNGSEPVLLFSLNGNDAGSTHGVNVGLAGEESGAP